MPGKKRTRPGGTRIEEPQCCKPYPDARFVDGVVVALFAHHQGEECRGDMQPMSLKEWNDEIHERASASSRSGGYE